MHSSGAELISLHRAGFKSSLIQNFVSAIGHPFTTPAVIFEDNQGTINLIRTQRHTDTVRHHDVKLAWLNENFLQGILVDCCTKPVNGSQLFCQIFFGIGVRFYPPSSLKHDVELQLDKFSWTYRLHVPSP